METQPVVENGILLNKYAADQLRKIWCLFFILWEQADLEPNTFRSDTCQLPVK